MLDPDAGYDCDECLGANVVINVDHNLWRCKRCYAAYTDEDIVDAIPTLEDEYDGPVRRTGFVPNALPTGGVSPTVVRAWGDRRTNPGPARYDRRDRSHLSRLRRLVWIVRNFRGWFER